MSNQLSVWLVLIEEANNSSRGERKAAGTGRITGWGVFSFSAFVLFGGCVSSAPTPHPKMIASYASTTKLTVPFKTISGVKS